MRAAVAWELSGYLLVGDGQLEYSALLIVILIFPEVIFRCMKIERAVITL